MCTLQWLHKRARLSRKKPFFFPLRVTKVVILWQWRYIHGSEDLTYFAFQEEKTYSKRIPAGIVARRMTAAIIRQHEFEIHYYYLIIFNSSADVRGAASEVAPERHMSTQTLLRTRQHELPEARLQDGGVWLILMTFSPEWRALF